MTGKKYRVVALILAAVILAAGGVLCYRHFHQTAQPVTAEASAETAAAETVIFRQKDDRWKDDALGDSAYHMADSGCLTCCVAAALQMQQISVDGLPEDADDMYLVTGDEEIIFLYVNNGEDTISCSTNITRMEDAGAVNQFFSEQGVYDGQGNLQWDVLEQVTGVPVLRQDAAELPEGALDEYLADGCFPIVRVKMPKSGSTHYVLLTGSEDGTYQCMDPLQKKEQTVPLSDFHNQIYAVRVLQSPK